MINYYIDNRQIANGEFGGGLSDDGDLTNMWPGAAFLGIDPEKMLKSLRLHMTAYYDQERPPEFAGLKQRSLPLFTNGLATIITDELQSLEEGIQVVGQLQLLDDGNPLYMERGMETALRMLNEVTQINAAGHRHFRSRFYGATRMAAEDPWQWSVNRSYYVLQSSYLVARYNGNPQLRKMIIEIADGLLAHQRNGNIFTDINFATDSVREDMGMARGEKPLSIFFAAYKMTGDKKYLEITTKKNPNKGIFDEKMLADRYREDVTNMAINEYINTEGSIWIDRLTPFSAGIQEDRLGGTALIRTNVIYPQHFVSWKFISPSRFDDAGIFLPAPSDSAINIVAYNLKLNPVSTVMTTWDVKPGKWRVRQGIDTNDDQIIDSNETSKMIEVERGKEISLTFAPRKYNIVSLELIEPSGKNFQELPDLAMGLEDVKITANAITVRIHNIGAVGSPATTVELKDAKGKVIATAQVPPLEAPVDLLPRWKVITIPVATGTNLSNAILQIDPGAKIKEITRKNSKIRL
jgi:hypothetical protein